MEFLRFLSSLHNPVTDAIFSVLTHIGGEIGFLVIAILLLWCKDKREGYYVLFTCFVGTVVNQVLKLLFRVPRPWVRDPSFCDIIPPAVQAEALGYSFPSGHTQSAVGAFGSMALVRPRRRKTVICLTLIALIAFSRMYLLVHTPIDVLLSLLLGAVLVFALYPLFASEQRMSKCMPYLLIAAYLLTVGMLIFAFTFPVELTDGVNLEATREAACTLHGACLGASMAYLLDRRYIHFPTEGRWYAQILKVVVGFAFVLILQNFTKVPLRFLCFGNEYVARAVRYFLVVAFAGAVWPLTFRFFSRLRIPMLEKKSRNADKT